LVRNEAFQQGLFRLMKNPEKLTFADRKELSLMFQDALRLEEGLEGGFSEFLLKQKRAEELLDLFIKQ